ncbi:MAG TPA: hypothetical protein VH139_04605 [Acidobacteriaceae bacterium]|nr:hypothetical protein [Acidobacteriaceae bacterium]
MIVRRFSRVFAATLLFLLGTVLLMHVHHGAMRRNVFAASMANGPNAASGGMAHMAGHMYMTSLRTPTAGDQQKADAVAAAAKQAMAPYQDYRKALADGYTIFLPNIPQAIYHFTKREYGFEAAFRFDASKPTSLLYKKTANGGYKLVGAMYTDRKTASEEELNERIPLSIARWHQHINFCKAPTGQEPAYFGADAKFGLRGSITTEEACDAAGGDFHPHLFGWMVHVYPYETDPRKIWSVDDDDQGHDNMDHSAMPGMQMN